MAGLLEHGGQPVRLGGAHPRVPPSPRELGDRAGAHQPPAVDDQDVVGGLLDLGEHVAGDEHGAPLGGQRAQEVAQPADALRVQAVGRLVEHEHRRVAEQRGGEPEPLAHAEGELADLPARAAAARSTVREHLVGAALREAGRRGEHPQVVAGGAARVEAGGLEQRRRPARAARSSSA